MSAHHEEITIPYDEITTFIEKIASNDGYRTPAGYDTIDRLKEYVSHIGGMNWDAVYECANDPSSKNISFSQDCSMAQTCAKILLNVKTNKGLNVDLKTAILRSCAELLRKRGQWTMDSLRGIETASKITNPVCAAYAVKALKRLVKFDDETLHPFGVCIKHAKFSKSSSCWACTRTAFVCRELSMLANLDGTNERVLARVLHCCARVHGSRLASDAVIDFLSGTAGRELSREMIELLVVASSEYYLRDCRFSKCALEAVDSMMDDSRALVSVKSDDLSSSDTDLFRIAFRMVRDRSQNPLVVSFSGHLDSRHRIAIDLEELSHMFAKKGIRILLDVDCYIDALTDYMLHAALEEASHCFLASFRAAAHGKSEEASKSVQEIRDVIGKVLECHSTPQATPIDSTSATMNGKMSCVITPKEGDTKRGMEDFSKAFKIANPTVPMFVDLTGVGTVANQLLKIIME